jgi:hypothetical protein
MSVDWWMDESSVAYPYKGILVSLRKKWSIYECYNINEARKHCTEEEHPVTEDHVLYDSTFVKCSKQRKIGTEISLELS